jgi:hypothetical protein
LASDYFVKVYQIPKEQKSDGLLEISVPGLPFGKQPTTWKIAIDEVGDSFTPKMVRWIAPGRRLENVYEFLDYTNLGGYQFPSRIEWVTRSYPATSPPTLLATGTVTLISARIPDEIADSTFNLDNEEKKAAVVWDWDQRKLTKSAPQLAKIKVVNRTTKMCLILMMLFSTGIVLWITVKKFAKDKAI